MFHMERHSRNTLIIIIIIINWLSHPITAYWRRDNQSQCWPYNADRLAGQVVKASASTAEAPGFESRLRRDFSGV